MSEKKQLQQAYNKFKKAPKYNLNSEELYCVCRRPDHGGELMVACDGCDEWFHFKCMGIDKKYKDLVSNFYCKFCDELQGKGKTMWKKKCRLPGCLKPAAIDPKTGSVSKYCSEAHGIQFLQDYVMKPVAKAEGLDEGVIGELFVKSGGYDEFEHLGQELPQLDGDLSESAKAETAEIDAETAYLDAFEKVYAGKERYLKKLKEKIKYLDELLSAKENGEEPASTAAEAAPEPPAAGRKRKRSKPKSKKKKGTPKVDLCGYDVHLRLYGKDWETFAESDEYKTMVSFDPESVDADKAWEDYGLLKDAEDDDGHGDGMIEQDETVFRSMCMHDRKKCMRHLTWYTIALDGLDLKMGEIAAKRTEINERKRKLAQSETIRRWEEQ